MRLGLPLFLLVAFIAHSSLAAVFIEEVVDIPKTELKKIRSWIRERTTSARLPFCWRRSYDRGVGKVPGRVADCPPSYTNNGATCGRGARNKRYPSKLAKCPSGFRNMGLTCYRGPSTYGKKCTLPWKKHGCKHGYTDNGCTCGRGAKSLSAKHMVCPSGYFRSKITARCHKKCQEGYTNTGDYCHRPVSTLGIGSMRCRSGEHKIGARCYGGRKRTSCFSNQDPEGGLCYKKCRSGYYGLLTICWQRCNKGWHNCGAACAASRDACATNVANQVVAPLVLAANVASMGLTTPATAGGAQTLKIAGKTVTSSKAAGKALINAVKKLQTIRPKNLEKGASVVRRIYVAKAGTLKKKINLTKKVSAAAYKASEDFATAYAKDFAEMTSPKINAEIDRRFHPRAALFIKKMWAMNQLSEMAKANGWKIAQSVLQAVSIADITGVTGVVEAYAKPKCQDHEPFPCSKYLVYMTGCQA